MTCCADDIQFMGMPCKYENADDLKTRDWVMVTATVQARYHSIYRGIGPILTAVSVEPAEQPKQEVATF